MKSKRIYPAFTISKKGEMSLKNGHPWVYCDELRNEPEGLKNGELCDVFSEKGSYLGTGFLSLNSKIRIRILSDNANENFSENFFRRRIRYAIDYRKTVMGDDFSACRLIFGEADGMPGLTIDKYGDILVSQVLSYGMDMIKDMIFRLLAEELEKDGVKVSGIMERNDVAIRKLEGLEQYKGWYRAGFLPEPPSNITEITENGIRYEVDVENGQKTGFFLDQKYNRLAVSKIAKGKKVLDCFTHTGSFALNAAMGGARHVTAVDVSQFAVDTARENAERNGLTDRMDFLCADVFDLLPKLLEEKADYDMIILDPPAFAKHKDALRNALQGYRKLNAKAFEKIRPGGILFTFSCSQVVSKENFRLAVFSAAAQSGRNVRILHQLTQPADHPVNIYHPEGEYLKGLVLYVE